MHNVKLILHNLGLSEMPIMHVKEFDMFHWDFSSDLPIIPSESHNLIIPLTARGKIDDKLLRKKVFGVLANEC